MGQNFSLACGSESRSLLNAAANGDVRAVKEVLSNRPELVEGTTNGGQNVFHIAAGKGDREVLQAIVEGTTSNGSSHSSTDDLKMRTVRDIASSRQLKIGINAQTNSGFTPIMLAAKFGHTMCVRYLLDTGADLFKCDKQHNRSVIHHAAAEGRHRVLKYLLSDSTLVHSEEGIIPLRQLRVQDISGQCRYMDSRAENGLTALHIAAVKGELACVKLFLAAGASMMVRTVELEMPSHHTVPNGSTPLHLAAQKGSAAIVQAMLQAHADAMGTLGNDTSEPSRRGWEQSTRIDLRSVANAHRQLPYHVAWQRGFRQTAQILNPTIPIDVALENVRELDEGFGAQKLTTLAAYALRKNLLDWLENYRVQLEVLAKSKEQREAAQKVIAQQKRKEMLKLHSQNSVDASINASTATFISGKDSGHTISPSVNMDPEFSAKQAPRTKSRRERGGKTEDILSTIHSVMDTSQHIGSESSKEASMSPRPSLGDPIVEFEEPAATDSPFQQSMQPQQATSTQTSRPQPDLPQTDSNKRPSSAAMLIKKSMKKLIPSRPPPPPPPSSGVVSPKSPQSAQNSAPAQKGHRRNVSWETFPRRRSAESALPESDSPPVAQSCLTSSFRSPFAQASQEPDQSAEDTGSLEGEPRPFMRQMSTHPSGVCLVDPPDLDYAPSTGLTKQKSKKLTSNLSFTALRSRKSSKNVGEMRAFQRAASIPGFETDPDLDDDCGICLEDPVNVGVNECCHKLCVNCALKLCQVSKKPPLCPFCRITITGFHGS